MSDSDLTLAHQLNATLGWAELGNMAEARAELARIGSEHLNGRPDLLEVRWVLESASGEWQTALEVAERLVAIVPENAAAWLHRAYALRRVPGGGLEKAAAALLPAFEKFPDEATVPYNLSCYACQLGKLEAARSWLSEAIKRGGIKRIHGMALKDPDLQPLWAEIESRS